MVYREPAKGGQQAAFGEAMEEERADCGPPVFRQQASAYNNLLPGAKTDHYSTKVAETRNPYLDYRSNRLLGKKNEQKAT